MRTVALLQHADAVLAGRQGVGLVVGQYPAVRFLECKVHEPFHVAAIPVFGTVVPCHRQLAEYAGGGQNALHGGAFDDRGCVARHLGGKFRDALFGGKTLRPLGGIGGVAECAAVQYLVHQRTAAQTRR